MSKDEIQKVTLGTNEALRVTADGEFIWHPEADAMIEYGDFTSSPAMRHILRALRKALAASVPWLEMEGCQMITEKALKLALEALECLKRDFDADQFEWEIADVAITAIKQARSAPVQVFDHVTAARQGLRDAQNRSRQISNLINCGTCGYPLAPEERTSLIERDGVMVKPAPVQEPVAWMFEDDEDNGHKTFRQTPPSPEVVAYLAKWNRPAWVPIYTTPPAAPDLQADLVKANAQAEHFEREWYLRGDELEATNRQVEILSDALAESRREVAALKAVQEPVAFFDPQGKGFYWAKPTKITAPVTVDVEPLPLYTTPPAAQRQWVGLTDEEITDIWAETTPYYHEDDFARAIEAKLKKLNT
jgi:hypothetical protein